MADQVDVFKNYVCRLQDKVRSWPGEKVILYGAGEHSRMVLKEVNWEKTEFIGFMDRSERKQSEGFLGYPVYPPEGIARSGATKIIISSFPFQEEIYKYLSGMELPGIEVVRLYTEEDKLTFIKERYAYCPKDNEVRPELIERVGKDLISGGKNRSPRILLIQVPFPFGNHRHKKILPMNLLYLAGYTLEKNPHAVIRILDGQIHDMSLNEMKLLATKDPWDIIGIGYWTGQAPVAFELSELIKEKTESLLVHGGVHPTLCPEEAAKYCDLMVLNEGEETFFEIVRQYPNREKILSIPGTAYNGENGLKFNPPRPPVKALDDFPFPAFHLIPDLKIYNAPMHVTGGLRVPLIGSRGCPYSCTFCSSPLIWNKKVRWRNPVKIVDEMEKVVDSHGITQFHFWDDNVMMKRDHMKQLCEEILRRGLKVNWCGLTRASHIIKYKEILPMMKKSGCVGIEIGIESFTEDSTDLILKGEGVQEMKDASRYMEEAGIAPLYTHMLFNPGENIKGYTEKQVFLDEVNQKNTAFLADSRLGQASTPHRKTQFEMEAKEQGEVFLKDHSTYVHHRINFIPNSLLDDVPAKNGKGRESPFEFLEIILQAIFDWDENMIDQYIEASKILWEKIDGNKSVRLLCEEIKKDMDLDDYRSKLFVCLSIVGLAREGNIKSEVSVS